MGNGENMIHKFRSSLLLIFIVINLSLQAQDMNSRGGEYLKDTKPGQFLMESGIDTTNIDTLKSILQTNDQLYSTYAATFLALKGYTDIIPTLHIQFDSLEDYYERFEYLCAMDMLGDSDITQYIYSLIDSAHAIISDTSRDHDIYQGIRAFDFLLDRHDYSRFQFIVDLCQLPWGANECELQIIRVMDENGENYREQIFTLLSNLVNLYPSFSYPSMLMETLERFLDKSETLGLWLTIAEQDTDRSTSDVAFMILLKHHPDHMFVLEKVLNKLSALQNDSISFEGSITLIYAFPFPEALLQFRDFGETLTNEFAKSQIRRLCSYNFLLREPPVPDSSKSILQIIDTLVAYKHRLASYNWLGDQSFVNELDSNLTSAKNYIVSGDSNNCARQIKLFQQKVDEEYRDSLGGDNKTVTIEGWKFLYYNAKYILERLPVPPPQYNLNIDTIGNGTVTKSPEFALYDSAATVKLTAKPTLAIETLKIVPNTPEPASWKFDHWEIDLTGTQNPKSTIMNGNKTVKAVFVPVY
jgi:hypothetical protein